MLKLVDVLKRTEDYFKSRGISSARLDAELIMSKQLGLSRIELYLQFEKPLREAELAPMRDMVRRRARREPLHWILGERSFYNHDFIVLPDVLVPRPDTETLVDAALAVLPDDAPMTVIDIGCGTGCIGLSLALERPQLHLYALDLSPEALQCARLNVEKFDLADRVTVLESDLFSNLPPDTPIDVVVSNPPYIATDEFAELEPEVSEYEPRLALDGGDDGLDVYRALISVAASRASRAVLVEVGSTQADAVRELFTNAGVQDIRIHHDLAGHPRVVEGRTP